MQNSDEILKQAEAKECRYWFDGQFYKHWGELQAAYLEQKGRHPMNARRVKVSKKVKLLMFF